MVNQWFRLYNTAIDRRTAGGHPSIEMHSCDLPFGAEIEQQQSILDETSHCFEMSKLIEKEGLKAAPFVEGILVNCAALRMLYNDLRAKFPDEDVTILTCRLNSDTAERFFSQMRGARANNPNMTATDFKYRFRSYLLGSRPEDIFLGQETNVRGGENDPVSLRTQVNFTFLAFFIN